MLLKHVADLVSIAMCYKTLQSVWLLRLAERPLGWLVSLRLSAIALCNIASSSVGSMVAWLDGGEGLWVLEAFVEVEESIWDCWIAKASASSSDWRKWTQG